MGQVFAVNRVRSAALRPLNYVPSVEQLRIASDKKRVVRLGSIVKSLGGAYKKIFSNVDCSPSAGVEVLSQTDMFASEPVGRFIRADSMADPDLHRIKKWQILVAGAGTLGETEIYGRSLIADARLADKYIAYHALSLTFEQPGSDLNLYTYAFLLSDMGVSSLRSTSYGTKILSMRLDLLADLPIPLPNDVTLTRVASLIRQAVEGRERYLRDLHAARRAVEDTPEMRIAYDMCAERKAHVVAWSKELPTLCAWNYASTGEALRYLLNKWSARVGDVLNADGLFYGLRAIRVPCQSPHGISFLSQRDVFLMRPVPRRIVHPGFDERFLFAKPNSIVMAGRGTLGEGEIFGRCALVDENISKLALTEDLLRIRAKEEHAELLYLFLSTLVGFRFVRSTAVGTKILNLRNDLLCRLPFPEICPDTRQTAESLLRSACASRLAANRAEAEAVRIVEQEVLPAWLA